MLVKAIIIVLILLILFLLASSKLVVKLGDSPYTNVFYVLMFITFLTLLQVVFCVYMYLKFRTKDGEEGPRGYQGFPGEKGDPGKCHQLLCRADSIRVMIEKIFEKKLNRELTPKEKKIIYANTAIFNKTIKSEVLTKSNENMPLRVMDMEKKHIKELHQYLTKNIELDYITLDNFDNDIKSVFS